MIRYDYTEEKTQEEQSDYSGLKDLLKERVVAEHSANEAIVPSEDGDAPFENPLASLKEINEDVVAWLTIPDTQIDLPIVRGEDNAFYLEHGFDKKPAKVGVPFMDHRCAADFSDSYTIIYGHHIKKHRMFTDLDLFKDKTFFEEHPDAELLLEDGVHVIRIVACLIVPAEDDMYQLVTSAQMQELVDHIYKNARFSRRIEEIDLSVQRLVALSTCSYEYEDARTVVVGYLVDE